MNYFKKLHLDLGLPHLMAEWKAFFSPQYLQADLIAGLTVALVAIPLSLAIALASGVEPATGLITAILAGIVCALFGGAPLTVSGPAAAMCILVADNIENFGLEGLLLMGVFAGLMQLLSGIFGLGKLARYVPLPVIAGFTAGIGVIIIVGQLPRAFGLIPPPESHTLDVLNHMQKYLHTTNYTSLVLVVATLGLLTGLPKLLPKIPPLLPTVLILTGVVYFFHLSVPLIGPLPQTLLSPHIPQLPHGIPLDELLISSFTIYLLASFETLLSSSCIDKLTNAKKHDADQELIGQGLGNMSVALFGGIPVTGVIARSAANVFAGAKTRRASIFHSLFIFAAVLFLSPLIALIPVVVLAGILFNVAAKLINWREFKDVWQTSRSEGLVYLTTFVTIIFADLIAGIKVGVMIAALIVLLRAARTHLHVDTFSQDGLIRLSLSGVLTFLSTGEIAELENYLEKAHAKQTVVLDLSDITDLDSSGANAIIDLFNYCMDRQIKFYIKGLPRRFESLFRIWGGNTILDQYYLVSESELRKKATAALPASAYGRLRYGVQRFYAERKYENRLFEYIVDKQDPHTLFITCADSRLMPSLITTTDPGELFTVRNVGNFIPPWEHTSLYSEGAALEFALNKFEISDIVICGHANCGAIQACIEGNLENLPAPLQHWIGLMRSQLQIPAHANANSIAQANVLNQIENLKAYPVVQKKLANLSIHAWFFDFDQNLVYEWNKEQQEFKAIENTQEVENY